MIYSGFVDHLVFRVADITRTERFYRALLGEPTDRSEYSVMYMIGGTRVFFTLGFAPPSEAHDKERVGLNHMAFGVRTIRELQTVKERLDSHGVSHSGVMVDPYGPQEFLWLDDPDGLRVEFYLRTSK